MFFKIGSLPQWFFSLSSFSLCLQGKWYPTWRRFHCSLIPLAMIAHALFAFFHGWKRKKIAEHFNIYKRAKEEFKQYDDNDLNEHSTFTIYQEYKFNNYHVNEIYYKYMLINTNRWSYSARYWSPVYILLVGTTKSLWSIMDYSGQIRKNYG